ncbi:MAG: sugar transferase [Actinomycetota bacterium]
MSDGTVAERLAEEPELFGHPGSRTSASFAPQIEVVGSKPTIRRTVRSVHGLPPRIPPSGGSKIGLALKALDIFVVSAAWLGGVSLLGAPAWSRGAPFLLVLLWALLSTPVVHHAMGLYRCSSCFLASSENRLLLNATAGNCVILLALGNLLDVRVTGSQLLLCSVLSLVGLVIMRSNVRIWLAACRKQGRFVRKIVIVGTNDHGYALYRLLGSNTDAGFQVVGVVGDPLSYRRQPSWAPYLGSVDDLDHVIDSSGSTGVFVASSDLPRFELNLLCKRLLKRGIHVQLACGLSGIDQKRFSTQRIGGEPVFYVSSGSFSPSQLKLKRAADLVLTPLILMCVAPVLLVAAAGILISDGRPILFKQQRVGLDGRLFKMFKLRTMVNDAESRLETLKPRNERSGPLFKLASDPRITPLGRFLRESSIDELPQLFNVLNGSMSLVGPRPALPDEVDKFDQELLARHNTWPGITGLWQLKGRDDPSFDAYQVLDLHYVDNWSLTGDLGILARTVPSVLYRALRKLAEARANVDPLQPLEAESGKAGREAVSNGSLLDLKI